ncbi:acyltransferase [Companilactobacillus nuruki]|uniref:Acyltransferase 3 domain-containing protein n=1 Tax=Companilactobacillus nuruki TaxID=1993540 RepID=A0A2N7AT17_9LACO|nr:acyltransferase family protein [Companilactobacillus nuruki]PMD68831.1 hypothetical protein CBP76_09015 [Companilactobacillus nuruki]
MVNKRNSAIECLRILSMFFIILGHFSWQTDWKFQSNEYVLKSIINSLWIGGKLGVNLFVLISGYFIISSGFKKKSFISIWITSYFYSILILILSVVFKINEFDLKNIVKTVFLSSSGYLNWFVTAYLGMYLLVPYMNKILLSFSRLQYHKFLLTIFFIFSVLGTLFRNPAIGTTGDDIVWLLVVYCFGAYIRIFENELKREIKKIYLWSILAISLFLSCFSVFIINYIQLKYNIGSSPRLYGWLIGGLSPLQLLSALCIFLFVVRINPFTIKFINEVASTTFSIYLIHANLLIVDWLWNNLIRGYRYENTPFVLAYGLLVSSLIFIFCSIIDIVMKFLFGKTRKIFIDRIASLVSHRRNDLENDE